MGCHVAEADDSVADVAVCCAGAVGVFVGCHPGENHFVVCGEGVVGTLLWDEEVAELAEDFFGGTGGCAVVG